MKISGKIKFQLKLNLNSTRLSCTCFSPVAVALPALIMGWNSLRSSPVGPTKINWLFIIEPCKVFLIFKKRIRTKWLHSTIAFWLVIQRPGFDFWLWHQHFKEIYFGMACRLVLWTAHELEYFVQTHPELTSGQFVMQKNTKKVTTPLDISVIEPNHVI